MAGLLMYMVLLTTNRQKWMPWTGLFAGVLLFLFITLEAPLSGMSINPARSVASSLPSGIWTSTWVYLAGPLIGMVAAARLYILGREGADVHCAKLHHANGYSCIFCDFQRQRSRQAMASKSRGRNHRELYTL